MLFYDTRQAFLKNGSTLFVRWKILFIKKMRWSPFFWSSPLSLPIGLNRNMIRWGKSPPRPRHTKKCKSKGKTNISINICKTMNSSQCPFKMSLNSTQSINIKKMLNLSWILDKSCCKQLPNNTNKAFLLTHKWNNSWEIRDWYDNLNLLRNNDEINYHFWLIT